MNKQRKESSALSDLKGNKFSRKNVMREWYKVLPTVGGLARMICRILKKSDKDSDSFDRAAVRVFNEDTTHGFHYIKEMAAKDLSIDRAIEMYNAENVRALRGEVIDPSHLHHLPEMKYIACVSYTNLIVRKSEYVSDGGMIRFEAVLFSPAFATEHTFTGPRANTKALSIKRWEYLFWTMYPGCDYKDPAQVVQASPDDIREVRDTLPPIE